MRSFQMSISAQKNAGFQIPENGNLKNHSREILNIAQFKYFDLC